MLPKCILCKNTNKSQPKVYAHAHQIILTCKSKHFGSLLLHQKVAYSCSAVSEITENLKADQDPVGCCKLISHLFWNSDLSLVSLAY